MYDKVMRISLCDPNIHVQKSNFVNFDDPEKLCKAFNDAYDCGGWMILQDLLNERVAEGDISDTHDFTGGAKFKCMGGKFFPSNNVSCLGSSLCQLSQHCNMLFGGAGGMGGVKKTQLFSQYNKH